MILNYLKLSLRSLLKHKVFSLVNLLGLIVSITSCLVILQYVSYESSYDEGHSNVFRVVYDRYNKGELAYQSASAYPAVGPVMKEEVPEVNEYTRLFRRRGVTMAATRSSGEEVIFKEDKVYYTDPSFFSVFNYPLIKGNPATALSEPGSAVITESVARKYFGNENPIGKVFQKDGAETYVVKGVLKDIPQNSHLKLGILLPMSTAIRIYGRGADSDWGDNYFYTYLKLINDASITEVESKMSAIALSRMAEVWKGLNIKEEFFLQDIEDIHLKSNLTNEAEVNGNQNTLYFFVLIAGLIIIIAWVNYINLSTARSIDRAKEVGIKKTFGGSRYQLMFQFLLEALILNITAIAVSLVLAIVLVHSFSDYLGIYVPNNLWNSQLIWFTILGMLILATPLVGAYPAFVLSSFRPIQVLKGNLKTSKQGVVLRKVLVVFQFATSIGLIIGTLMIGRQIDFMKKQDLGFDKEQTLIVSAPNIAEESSYHGKLLLLKSELIRFPSIKYFVYSTDVPGKKMSYTPGWVRRVNSDPEDRNTYYVNYVDYDFIKAYGLSLIEGRDFSEKRELDKEAVILNEAAMKLLGFEDAQDAVTKEILHEGRNTVIGVIRNYHQQSLKHDVQPIILRLDTDDRSWTYSIKIDTENLGNTLAVIKEKYNAIFPGNTFDYYFLDELFDRQYLADQKFEKIFTLFAALAIFIGCMGLYNLTSFTIQQRTKEIAIRKTLGAKNTDIFYIFVKGFVLLVLIASFISWGVLYFAISEWLETFAFRVPIGFEPFIISSIIVLAIAMIAISYQLFKATRLNAAVSLRNN